MSTAPRTVPINNSSPIEESDDLSVTLLNRVNDMRAIYVRIAKTIQLRPEVISQGEPRTIQRDTVKAKRSNLEATAFIESKYIHYFIDIKLVYDIILSAKFCQKARSVVAYEKALDGG